MGHLWAIQAKAYERVELHAFAGPMTKDNTHRENSLPDRIDFDSFKSFDFASPSGFLQKRSLVRPRVNHCDLRDSKWTTVVGPTERRRFAVVVLDECDDALG